MDLSLVSAMAMGIGISACCGFRVFIPMLAASIASYFNWIPVNTGMEWLGTLPALICFGTAAVIEIAAYYFPFLDNILDTVAAPLSVIAGTILASSFIPLSETSPVLKWGIGLLAGGATAGTIQLGTGILRLFSTKATVGAGNPVIATGENLAAITGSALSFLIPIIICICLLALVFYIFSLGIKQVLHRKSPMV